MPRVSKKEQQLKLEPDGFAAVLTLEYLQGLSRAQIQELAKVRWIYIDPIIILTK